MIVRIDNLKISAVSKETTGNEVKKVTKFLPSNLTSSVTDVASLRITGLVVGKSYRVYSQAYMTSSAASGASMFVKHNGVSLHRHNYDSAASNFAALASVNSTEFVATSTEINIDVSLGTSTSLIGNNSTEASFIEVIELPYDLVSVANF